MTQPDKTILIIDDDPDIVQTLGANLSLDRYKIASAHTGKEGIDTARELLPDLILLDLNLPDLDGIAICEILRKEFNVPIIMLTARDTLSDKVLGLKSGADDYMVKPFSPRELSARVKAVLRRTASFDRSEWQAKEASPFLVDEARGKITYFSTVLELSRYEFRLLEIFVSRPGQIFTREKLMERVWDDPEMSMDRTVDAHIKNIRGKLKKIKPDLDPIQTHRSIGYSLKEEL